MKNYQKILRQWIIPAATGIFSAFIIILLSLWSYTGKYLELLELKLLDYRIITNPGSARHFPNKNIVIIGIDEKTYEKIEEPSIFWNIHYEKVFKALLGGGAKVIGFDSIMAKPSDEYLVNGIEKVMKKLKKDGRIKIIQDFTAEDYIDSMDQRFAQAIMGGRVVLASYLDLENKWIKPLDLFVFAVKPANVALINVTTDIDGTVRLLPIYGTDKDNKPHLGFDILLASKFLGREFKEENGKKYLGGRRITEEEGTSYRINYAGPPGTFFTIPFWKVLDEASSGSKEFFTKNFKDKIVIIGATGMGSQDIAITPFNLFNAARGMAGVEVHANAVNTLINSDFIFPAANRINLLVLIVISVFTALVCFHLKPFRGVILTVITAAVFFYVSVMIFHKFNLWLIDINTLSAMPVSLAFAFVYRYIAEDREKNRIRKIFGNMVSTSVAEEILKSRRELSLGGTVAEVSILFSDINEFTPLSERMPPAELVSILNDYFTHMEEIIFKYKGTLNQFVGDEIMVIFGAPATQPDHAELAVFTAIEMKEELIKWQEKQKSLGRESFDVKIGIHSGAVIAGCIGSPRRMQYSTMGDVVNTASRIEGLNKVLNTDILISEDTYKRVGNIVEAESMGLQKVKGKKEAIEVYKVIGKKQKEPENQTP
ncbi:MAG: adenylate/guanylate cyclase domain-containing protein [Firmicutes bacterium]|nr:adenylate/guanylate cyclase domain-containing protein [Bacillota bacterium]